MKFTQEEFKKIFFMFLVLAGFLYFYFDVLLRGITTNETRTQSQIRDLEPKIRVAKEQIKRTKDLEDQAGAITENLEQIKSLIPVGAPIAWFPPKIADFFKRQGIDKAVTRLNEEVVDKQIEGFRKLSWTIELPKVAFPKLGIAVAGLENEDPLLEIFRVQISESKDDPVNQNVVLNVVTIVKQ